MNGLPQNNALLRSPLTADITERNKYRADLEAQGILAQPVTFNLAASDATNLLSGNAYTSGTSRVPFAVNRLTLALAGKSDRRTMRVWLEVNRDGDWTAIATLTSGGYIRAELRSADQVRVRAQGDDDDVLYSYSIAGRYLRNQ
jgi:hypothetical protein